MISQSRKDGNGRDRSHEVTEAAKNRLQESPYWAVRTPSCDCRRATLVLRGHLPTFYQKELAQEAGHAAEAAACDENIGRVGHQDPC